MLGFQINYILMNTLRVGIMVPGRSVLGEPIIDHSLVVTSWVCLLTFDWPILALPEL